MYESDSVNNSYQWRSPYRAELHALTLQRTFNDLGRLGALNHSWHCLYYRLQDGGMATGVPYFHQWPYFGGVSYPSWKWVSKKRTWWSLSVVRLKAQNMVLGRPYEYKEQTINSRRQKWIPSNGRDKKEKERNTTNVQTHKVRKEELSVKLLHASPGMIVHFSARKF